MSHVADWRDCKGGGFEEDDDDNNEVDNNNDGLDDRERNDEIGEEDVDCIDDREFDEDDYNG